MRRQVLVVFAVVMAAMLVLVQPAGAAQTALVVGSSHTTDSDFQNADTLDNVTVQGSGDSASVVLESEQDTIDTFEDNDMVEYTENDVGSGSGTQSTTVKNGSYALEIENAASSDSSYVSQSGLDYYPSQGDTWSYWVQSEQYTSHGFAWIGTTSQDSGYIIQTHAYNDRFAILRMDDGTATDLAVDSTTTISSGAWYQVEVSWETDGTITATLFDESGNQINQVSATDTTYTSQGGIFWKTGGATSYFDSNTTATKAVDSGTYIGATHTVDNVDSGFTNLSLSNATAEVTWQQSTDGGSTWSDVASATYTSSGNKTQSFSGDGQWRANVTFIKDGTDPTAQLHDEGIQFTAAAPELDNSSVSPADGAGVTTRDVDLEINVSDGDFPLTQGDSVNASFYVNGEYAGSDILTQNRTASITYSDATGGENTWYVVAEDEWVGSTTSQTFTFETPGEIEIRNETGDHELLNQSVTVTGQFYSGEMVFEETTSTGKINMSGLPADRQYILTLEADGFHRRTIVIESLYETSTAYMLNTSRTSVYNEFVLNDLTGDFSTDDTTLTVQKALNTTDNDDIEWVTLAGDYFGADGTFKAELEKDQRHRLIVENEAGDTRSLGPFIPVEDGLVSLDIGRISWAVEEPETLQWETNTTDLSDENPDPFGYVQFKFLDPNESTTDLHVKIYEQNNRSNVLYNETHAGPFGELSIKEAVEDEEVDTNWVVDWSATRNGEQISGKRAVHVGKYPVQDPFDNKWGATIVAGAILFTGLIFGGVHSNFGAIAASGVAATLWFIGWYQVSVGIVILAVIVGGLYVIGDSGGPR